MYGFLEVACPQKIAATNLRPIFDFVGGSPKTHQVCRHGNACLQLHVYDLIPG